MMSFSRSSLSSTLSFCANCWRSQSQWARRVPTGARMRHELSRRSIFLQTPNSTSILRSDHHFNYSYSTIASESVRGDETKIDLLLSLEEEDKVLKTVNQMNSSEDLMKYLISKKKADELIKRKKSNGNDLAVSSLEELISIVGTKSSTKFLCSILDKPVPVNLKSAMFPTLTTEQVNNCSSVLSLIIVGDRLSWTLIDRTNIEGNVALTSKSWRQITYSFKPRMHFLTLLKEMETAIKEIPDCDCDCDCDLCLLEEYPVTMPTPYTFNFHMHMAQVKSIILGLLSARSQAPLFASIKTTSVARLFNTFVGSEKVSGQHVLDDLLLNQKVPVLTLPDAILVDYNSSESKVKEGLSQAFLLNLSYWKITKQLEINGLS